MRTLAIDIGSSGVRAAILSDARINGRIAQSAFDTEYDGVRAEVPAARVWTAFGRAISMLGRAARSVDVIALAGMSPSWVAMDRAGKAITPIVTHQDRRSVQEARDLESRLGQSRWLGLAGNPPLPGSISVTTWFWHARHAPSVIARADLVGHVTTLIHRRLTGSRVTDPSHASFMGLYRTTDLGGWCDELLSAADVPRRVLPEVFESNRIAGRIGSSVADSVGLLRGTPVLAGMVDTSAAFFLRGATAGQLVNVAGSTDVLALCTDAAHPRAGLLTRALGVGRRWLSVNTLAAGGSSLEWARRTFFSEFSQSRFHRLVKTLAQERQGRAQSPVLFDPHLAGDRMSIEQRRASFTGLTLATSRHDMLRAVIQALILASGQRLELLRSLGAPIRRNVVVSGGVLAGLGRHLYRDWPGRWRFAIERNATLRGLGMLRPVV